MSNKEHASVVPKLRFPEFRCGDAWEKRLLREVCSILQGYGFPEALQGKRIGKYPFCKVSDISRAVAENGGELVAANNYVDDDELLKLRAKLIPRGATVFAKIGEALRLNRRAYVQRSCLIDNNVTGLKAIDGVADDYFVYLLSQLIDLNNHCGGAVPSVNKSTLEEIEVIVPGSVEQAQIADCLSSLDGLIAAQARKVDAYKTHKKGLMQQLFPREGETQPRLRFPEFLNAVPWKLRKVSSMLVETQRPIALFNEVEYSLVTVKRRYGGLVARGIMKGREILVKSQFEVRAGDFLISKRQIVHNACGIVTQELDGFVVSNEYSVLTPKPECSIEFFSWFAMQPIVSASFMNCSVGIVIEKMLFKLPAWLKQEFLFPSLPEQQRIADLLTSIDNLISAATQELDTLKIHKKALMQQMFPSMEAA